MEEQQEVNKAKSYTPTEAMRNNAKRGLAAREKAPKSQKGGFDAKEAKAAGVGSGVARARDAINGNLSLESVKRMYSFLSRAKQYYKPNERTASGNLTPGTQAYLLWTGPAGLAWSRNILRQEGLLKSVDKALEQSESTAIIKSTEEEMKLATFVVLVPDEVDLHGDIYDELTVLKACNNYNKYCRKSNLFHLQQTESFSVVQSWTAPVDTEIEGRFIKKGTWLCTVECHSDELWKLIKSGDICSVSIGASALTEYLNDEE